MSFIVKKPKKNFVNNSELRKEINASKMTFCEFTDPKYAQYDLIVLNEKAITKKVNIKKAKEVRLLRLLDKRKDELFEQGMQSKDISTLIKSEMKDIAKSIKTEDLVFRVMTNDHIPMIMKKEKEVKHYVNFPPFKHYAILDEVPVCVGISHWKDGVGNGQFMASKGKLTDRLGKLFLLMAEKYSNHWRWVNYTYKQEMVLAAICQLCVAALKFDESKSDNAFAYLTTIIDHSFRNVNNDEHKLSNIRNDLMVTAGYESTFSKQVDNDMAYRAMDGNHISGVPETMKKQRRKKQGT